MNGSGSRQDRPDAVGSDVLLQFTSTIDSFELYDSIGNITDGIEEQEESSVIVMTIKGFAMGLLILMALFGNALVIASVIRIRKLRTITNHFVIFKN